MSLPNPESPTQSAAVRAYVEETLAHSLGRRLLEDNTRFVGVLDIDGAVIFANSFAIAKSGLSRDAVLGNPVWTVGVFHGLPNAEADWRARLAQAAAQGGPVTFEDHYSLAGEDVLMHTELSSLRDQSGEDVIGFLATTVDVDRLRKAEARAAEQQRRLEVSEEQFRVMADALPQMAWISRVSGASIYFAPKWQAFTGYSADQLTTEGVWTLIHPDDRELVRQTVEKVGETDHVLVFRLRRHDGVYRWMESRMAFVDDSEGGRWFGATLDITDRVERESEMTRQQEQLRATLKLTGFGIYTWLIPEDRFTEDSQLDEILGVPMGEMKKANAYELFFAIVHAEDREDTQASIAGAMVPGGADYQAEFRIIRPADGGYEERWVSAIGTVEFDERGEPLRLIGVFADITDERLEAEGRLRLQKMEAIGTLASGIAHDFNNVIGAILSYARVAEAEIRAGASPATSVAEIARGAHRAGDIVRRLLTFSRDVEPRRVAFQLADVVEEAETLLRPTLPSGVVIQSEYSPDLPAAVGDPTQLHQVVVNLLTNAGQALGEAGGSIGVHLTHRTVAARSAGITSALDPGGYLVLTVVDDGPGMSDATASRIFDPFFTTKSASDGTGLGLAAVQSIVKNHGGSIAVETSPGNGARFTVHLPVAAADAADERRPEPTGPLPDAPGAVRVLFVDDEQALVRLAYRAMPYHGCVVSGFTDPREAIAAFEADPQAFDAVITDYSMPGLTGLELTERVRAIRPELPVVLTSGYLTGAAQDEAEDAGVGAVVPKPCSIDTLADEVMRLLAR